MPHPDLSMLALVWVASAQSELLAPRHVLLPSRSIHTEALGAADFDGDGDVDLLVGGPSAEPEELFLNDGRAVFVDASDRLPDELNDTADLGIGDLDGDGDEDAYVAAWTTNRVWLNNGAAYFATLDGAFPLEIWGTLAVALGDVDLDGDLDALLGLENSNGICLNAGDGTFESAVQIPGGRFDASDDRGVALLDVDLDGDLDALTVDEFDVDLLLNDGEGGFTATPTPLLPIYAEAYDLASGDIDADGDVDAVASTCGGPLHVFRNEGNGTLTVEEVGSGCGDVVLLSDLDGDLDLDVLIGHKTWQNYLFWNDGTGVFTDATSELPQVTDRTRALAAADFDGDSDVDLVFGNHLWSPTRVLLSNASQVGSTSMSFRDAPTPLPIGVGEKEDLLLADLDADGDLDCVAADDWTDALWLNDGSGFFVEVADAFDGGQSRALAAGDVDDDGDTDLFVAGEDFGDPVNHLFLNDGSAGFTDHGADELPLPTALTSDVAFVDLDNDGRLDLVLGNGPEWPGAVNSVYRNTGSVGAGLFDDVTPSTWLSDRTTAVELGDLDGNGWQDLLVGNNGQNRIHISDGNGFTEATASLLPVELFETADIEVGDVDSDGDLDLVSGDRDQAQLLLNDGAGAFTPASTPLPQHEGEVEVVELADFNLDGSDDLLIGRVGGALLLDSLGGGMFADPIELAGTGPPGLDIVAIGDIDADGDLDAIVGNEQKYPSVLRNLHHQLAWQGVPAIGKPLSMDITGTPGANWILAASTGLLALPLLPYGILAIDPGALLLVTAGTLDSLGHATSTHAVPTSATLVGFPLHWQAMIGSQLTNRETTVFTDL